MTTGGANVGGTAEAGAGAGAWTWACTRSGGEVVDFVAWPSATLAMASSQPCK